MPSPQRQSAENIILGILDEYRFRNRADELTSARIERKFNIELEKLKSHNIQTAHLMLSQMSSLQNDPEGVRNQFLIAESFGPLSARSYFNYAVSLTIVGSYDEASKAALQALSLKGSKTHYMQSISLLTSLGDFEVASKVLSGFRKAYPEESKGEFVNTDSIAAFLRQNEICHDEVSQMFHQIWEVLQAAPIELIASPNERYGVSSDNESSWLTFIVSLPEQYQDLVVDLNFELADRLVLTEVSGKTLSMVSIRFE